MTVSNFMSKAGSYQDLGRGGEGGTMCPSRGMIRQQYPGAARVNRVFFTETLISKDFIEM